MQMDMKSLKESGRWSVDTDVESMAWDPHNEHAFVVSCFLSYSSLVPRVLQGLFACVWGGKPVLVNHVWYQHNPIN